MQSIKKITITFVLCGMAAAAATLGGRPALAAQPKPAAAPGDLRTVIGTVNVQRVFEEADATKQGRTEVQGLGQSLDRVLQRLNATNAFFLTETEIRELAGLYEKQNPTDDEKKRVGALEAKAQTASEDLTKIQNTPTPTDAQKQRLTELTGAQQKGVGAFRGIQQEYQERLRQREEDLGKKVEESMNAAISKVAQEKNLAFVFTSQIVPYSSNDITTDVIKAINKK